MPFMRSNYEFFLLFSFYVSSNVKLLALLFLDIISSLSPKCMHYNLKLLLSVQYFYNYITGSTVL